MPPSLPIHSTFNSGTRLPEPGIGTGRAEPFFATNTNWWANSQRMPSWLNFKATRSLPYTARFSRAKSANGFRPQHPFCLIWHDRDGRRYFSMRSEKMAQTWEPSPPPFGGGGHTHAAGFSVALGPDGSLPNPSLPRALTARRRVLDAARMIPLHDDNPTERTPVVTITFIVVCVARIFVSSSLLPTSGEIFVFHYGAIPAVIFGHAALPPKPWRFRPFRRS